ncbi:MAG TPA: 3-oxoadipate enol-lactonase [Pseudomonas sp.]|uniref:alpha/beta fold hydrolase n=1 Tax=unclassified Pseudomonas TaxID=196821 RepID=UPI000ED6D517|nr:MULTISPECIES: alpha/beta hydrolase [unclassified Pseudomonas]HAB03261.1 3-oxoadipate enol-lactonase [Pseudomonas sp.]
MASFDHRGCSLHYQQYGQGEPLVLLHGLGSSSQDWELQVPELSLHYRVIVMDIRGHGRSAKPRGGYSIATFSEDLLALLEHLQTGPVHFVGLSMGGMVGFQFAVDHRQWLRSLCIVNSAPQVKRRTLRDWSWWFKRWSLARLLSVETVGRGLAARLFPKPGQTELRQKMAERWARNDKRAYLKSFDAIVDWGVQERINDIRCPTLVIAADQDYTPIQLKEHYVALMPNARLVVIADSRHATPLDQPEVFNQTLLQFLAAASTSQGSLSPC